jgi:putative endonuclease
MYVAHCKDDSYYCGITTDVERRIQEHNGKGKKGAKYTRSRRPVIVIFTQEFSSRSQALKAEAYFKSLNRAKKLRYMVDAIDARLDGQMTSLQKRQALHENIEVN